jgi:hypothetical protein
MQQQPPEGGGGNQEAEPQQQPAQSRTEPASSVFGTEEWDTFVFVEQPQPSQLVSA